MADREPRNKNRLDYYRKLLPKVQEFDQASGAHGFIAHWDDPDAAWDSGDVEQAWDAIGLSPVIQELFHVIETSTGEDLEALESLAALVDPLRCPESRLHDIAASFGYQLDQGQSEAHKRNAVLGLIDAYRSQGQFAGFKVFYRLLGFRIIDIFPLWKKDINEARDDYSRERFRTATITADPIGPSGLTSYVGKVNNTPVKPGTVRFTDGVVVVRDDVVRNPETISDRRGFGNLIGPTVESGSINYATGDFTLTLAALAVGAVTASYEHVLEEWPYHAARMDLELNLSPGGIPVPLLDSDVIDGILRRFDEVRPVHVRLRVLALVVELRDEFSPGASDQAACVTKLKNVLTGQPFPGILGLDHTYFLDAAYQFADDELRIFEDHAMGTDVLHQPFEDRAAVVCPLDQLTITGPPGGPIYA